MKYLFPILILLNLTACKQNYTCNCTYVPDTFGPNGGKANIEENTEINRKYKAKADIDCSDREDKYMGQFYKGTCTLD